MLRRMTILLKAFLCLFFLLQNLQAEIIKITLPFQVANDKDLQNMEQKASILPEPKVYGEMISFSYYTDVIDLIMLASSETKNCRYFIENNIFKDLKSFNKILDIGTGSGECSQLTAQLFKKVTLVDPSNVALDNLNFSQLKNCKELIKINSTFQEAQNLDKDYDLIVFAHVFYYIPPEDWIKTIEKAYNLLAPKGAIFIVFNRGGTREQLVQHFGAQVNSFDNFAEQLLMKYPQAKIYISNETITTRSLKATKQLCGLFLKDVNITANTKEVENYINKNFKNNNGFMATMEQTFIKIDKI